MDMAVPDFGAKNAPLASVDFLLASAQAGLSSLFVTAQDVVPTKAQDYAA